MDKVRFGFFPGFNDPTLLFFGSGQALRNLQDALSNLEPSRSLKLETDERFIPLNGVQIVVSFADKDRGMQSVVRGKPIFKWNLSKDDAITNIEKIASVIGSEGPSHNYLDGWSDDVVVVVSKGEYPDTFAP